MSRHFHSWLRFLVKLGRELGAGEMKFPAKFDQKAKPTVETARHANFLHGQILPSPSHC